MDYTQNSPNSYHWPLKELSSDRFFGGHGFMEIVKYLSENDPVLSSGRNTKGDEGQVRMGPMEAL